MANFENLKAKMARLKAERGAAAASNGSAPHEDVQPPLDKPEPPSSEILAPFHERREERRIVPMRQPDSLRVLPHSVEAAQALLGSMLVAPETAIPIALDALGSGGSFAFCIPAHQIIYHEIIALHEGGTAVDLVTLTQVLIDQKLIDQVGGTIDGESGPGHWYVTKLFSHVPSASNIASYLEIVQDKKLARDAVALGSELLRRAEDDDAADLVVWLKKQAGQFAHSGVRRSTLTVRTLDELHAMHFDEHDNYFGDRVLAAGQSATLLGPGGVGRAGYVCSWQSA